MHAIYSTQNACSESLLSKVDSKLQFMSSLVDSKLWINGIQMIASYELIYLQ